MIWKAVITGPFEVGASVIVLAGAGGWPDALRPVAERNGMTLAQLALAWTVAQPGVTAAMAGTRSAARMREDAAAGSIELTHAQLEEIDQQLASVTSI